ncbi:pyrroline-5-carboxylate reductase [Lysobacter korlensis]|uniref:Pyrroline-5-carboxylate reductase n=1 Tax=Lysobacter korlensis TaxID=553636 RepID=A0ABV6S0D6_9GAMM
MTEPTPSGSTDTIAFIGGGNMARSLIGGLVARGHDPGRIRVAEPVESLRAALATDFGVQTFEHARDACDGATQWLLAVKPQVMRQVCMDLAPVAQAQSPLVLSVAAGITAGQLQRWLGGSRELAIVRAMPNTPALLGAGVTGLFASAAVDATQRKASTQLLAAAGTTVWIDDEAQMDAVTAVSGSGPAYVFLLAEAMQQAGESQGLPPQAARALVQQTLLGAATMLARLEDPAPVLRARVTSPGGTTQAAIETFEAGGFQELVGRAIAAATHRGRELSATND